MRAGADAPETPGGDGASDAGASVAGSAAEGLKRSLSSMFDQMAPSKSRANRRRSSSGGDSEKPKGRGGKRGKGDPTGTPTDPEKVGISLVL